MVRYRGSRKQPGQKRPPLTHFLCLPLVTPESRPQLEASMKQFQDAVAIKEQASLIDLEHEGGVSSAKQGTVVSGVHPKAIRPVGVLHCTLGVMSLSKQKLDEAVELLQSLDVSAMLSEARKNAVQEQASTSEQTAESKPADGPTSLERPISPPKVERSTVPLKVDLKGLVSMHAPQQTSILYSAPSDPSERLYPFCLALQKLFTDKGFLVPDDRPLKLHATVVNTIYAKGRKQPPKRSVKQQTLDASQAVHTEQAGKPLAKADAAGMGEQPETGEQEDRSQGHGPNATAPLKIDATAILERYKDFVWAENVVLDRVAICEMGAKKLTDAEGKVVGEEYTEVAVAKLSH
ncbi:hypothetical protein LTR36_010671 [Oleoguttula mirabilis]|uniref:A-kinase anchor protein 7-like phosphoesterase domain-containing protein n=1 Tax=Oleoguttula mirabilis TaxID=1507867 RepID=A0AAV9JQQ2_9PEZI|nr:hypothetical protein LTR36_010671 [Oleoguttula mirabilis]